ncbi:MAG: thioesterase family protein [Candidatus Omnitrophica bacterium]|nr:thioesterase family protein [Candidatus Omnitrophota bacterium]
MKIKIFYHDTDCGGVVYYANYLKFFEQARTAHFEKSGLILKNLVEKDVMFVVARQEVDYKFPARYADTLEVSSRIVDSSSVKLNFEHEVRNQDDKLICRGRSLLVCVGRDLKPKAIPDDLRRDLKLEEK